MKKTLYIVATKENKDGKKWACVIGLPSCYNLISAFTENTITANVCDTKKEAYDLMEFWNECFKKNGTLAY